ncbi:MAG: ABC transporter permease [Ilumatobacter sp.]|uniref:ABC transporter permease n=1 Tax=Ilumatobacter sp. TaxID=1967498 RepID=UPI003298ED2A
MNQSIVRRVVLSIGAPLAAVVFAVALSSVVLLISGNNPLTAFTDMLENASRLETFVDILNNATPLYISGVAAAIGFRMNLFNIGVEGQYLIAAFFAAAVGSAGFVVDLPAPLHVAVILLVAMSVGAAWAGVAGVLKVTRGINEVISTIMLNFIAVGGVIAWLLVEFQDDSGASNSGTTPLDDSGRLPSLNRVLELVTREIGRGRELTGVFVIAIVVGVGYHLFINRTRVGFDFRASGYNPLAARAGGVPPKRMIMYAMLLSGATAGLVGMFEVLSDKGQYSQSFVRGIGFNGIAVALIGRNNAVGIGVGALLFGFLSTSSGILQITGSATPEIVEIMKGIIVLSAVVAYEVVRRIRLRDEAKSAAEATERRDDSVPAEGSEVPA